MRSKLVTISFKVPLEDYQDYHANLRELGIYHHSEDLRNYVQGFNRSFGVDVILNRNTEKIGYLQKENKALLKIRKEKLDHVTNKAFKEIRSFTAPYNVSEGELSLPGSEQIIKELARIQLKNNIDFPTLVDMLESNISTFKDESIRDELLCDVIIIREKFRIQKSEIVEVAT